MEKSEGSLTARLFEEHNKKTLCPNCKKNNLCGASFLALCKECLEQSPIYKSETYKKFVRNGE